MLEKHYLECTCSSSEHTIHLSLDREEKNIYAHVALTTGGFLYRLKHAVKYLFGYQCKYGMFDEVILDRVQQQKLLDLIKSLDD